jgi:predicted MPP superfamily phosphohydrolase
MALPGSRRARLAVAGAGALAGAAVGGWSVFVEPRQVHVRRLERHLHPWPKALDGLRVAVLSDLHAGAPHVDEDKVARIVAKVNAERPDVVALLGDYVDPTVAFGGTVSPEAVAERLGELNAPLGSFAVLGNHDWLNDGERVKRALRHAAITVLENDAASLGHGGCVLWIVGLADASERAPDTFTPFSLIPPDAPAIVLTHDPDLFASVPDRAALTLAGHTHGGQVNVPVLRRLVAPSPYGGGEVVEGEQRMYVSRGIGTSRLPIRFRAPPEIAVLTLRSGRD